MRTFRKALFASSHEVGDVFNCKISRGETVVALFLQTENCMAAKTLNLPIIVKDSVYHVGTLNPANKKGFSYEGKCLSVSECPDDWVCIAQLGGLPCHQLAKTGGRFLDFHALLGDKKKKKLVYQWGWQKEYVEIAATVYKISYYDDEFEREVYTITDSEEEAAEAELEDQEVEKIKNHLVPTKEAQEQSGYLSDRLTGLDTVLAILIAEEMGLDGVWWDDDYDPDRLSAPRGGILPSMVPTWEAKLCDDEEGES